MTTLKNLVKLSSCIEIFIPSTTNVNVKNESEQVKQVENAQKVFAELFGGATTIKVVGSWVSPVHLLVNENIVIVQSYCTTEQLNNGIDTVIRLAESVKSEMAQEAISLKVNNELYFV